MLRTLTSKLIALSAGLALFAGASTATAPVDSCFLTAYSNTGWYADTDVEQEGFFVLIQADVIYQGPGGLTWGSGGGLAIDDSDATIHFSAAGGNHFFWPLNGADWGDVASICVEDATVRYDAI